MGILQIHRSRRRKLRNTSGSSWKKDRQRKGKLAQVMEDKKNLPEGKSENGPPRSILAFLQANKREEERAFETVGQ